MSEQNQKTDFSDIKSRRSASSNRRLSLWRRLYYFIGLPVLMGLVKFLWSTYRVKKVIGAEIAEKYMRSDGVSAPCYWHQHLLLANLLLRQQVQKGFRPCFLISASVDGDVPSRIAEYWGAEVIRGSANNTGALVLRDMHQAFKRGVSVVSVADGPNGPQHEFKMGVVLMARIAGVPMIPVGFAVDRAWYLDRWDRFMIPKPFARVVMAIGEPIEVPKETPVDQLEQFREAMENAVNSLAEVSKQELEGKTE